ncbi:hypothetical protein K9B32_13390 [Rhizobium sp. 3T7]|uniref:hypothetical protein n=1 Tax=Rhizobium sp. 3T7 TaxID=2874922 RepID=UPI001CCA0524|nr:hypothetical protein [Rhizobium sp. 3T7]MBZ9791108.1 hypothetical protein [Rhizobium sp. 3T7]
MLPSRSPAGGKERRIVCVHEAGHAFVGLAIGYRTLTAVAVVREVRTGKALVGGAYFEKKTERVRSRQSYLDEIRWRLGGIAAESVVFHTTTGGVGGTDEADLAQAADRERLRHIQSPTLSDRDRLRRSMPEVENEVSRILGDRSERARSITKEKRSLIEELAARLYEEGFVEGTDVLEMIERSGGWRRAGEP